MAVSNVNIDNRNPRLYNHNQPRRYTSTIQPEHGGGEQASPSNSVQNDLYMHGQVGGFPFFTAASTVLTDNRDIVQENLPSQQNQAAPPPPHNHDDVVANEFPTGAPFSPSYWIDFPDLGETFSVTIVQPSPRADPMHLTSEWNFLNDQSMEDHHSPSPAMGQTSSELSSHLMEEEEADITGVRPEDIVVEDSTWSSVNGTPEDDEGPWQIEGLYRTGFVPLD